MYHNKQKKGEGGREKRKKENKTKKIDSGNDG